MPPRKPKVQLQSLPAPAPYPINPICAANLATIAERLNQTVEIQARITETVYGNGKTGLEDQTKENTRIINEIIAGIKAIQETHQEDVRARKAEATQRRTDVRKWWLGVGIAVITGLFAIATTIIGSDQIMALILKTH